MIVVTSRADEASRNIREELLKLNFSKIHTIDSELIYAENINKQIEEGEDFFIFASRHAAEQHRKTLCLHVPGNFSQARFGGKARQLCKTNATFMKIIFLELLKQAKSKPGYEVTLEVTHHGPYLEKPCCFIEIGSSEEEWKDREAAKVIAKTIVNSIKEYHLSNHSSKWKIALAFGGGHYCSDFNKVEKESDFALSHICPKYAIDKIDKKMLRQMIDKTVEKIDLALIDKKGLNAAQRTRIENLLNSLSLSYKRL